MAKPSMAHGDFSGSPLVWGLTALSYIENDTIIVVRKGELARLDTEQLPANVDSFEQFCDAAYTQYSDVRPVFDHIVQTVFFGPWINEPPGLRLLGEHHYWRWYEALCVLEAAQTGHHTSASLAPFVINYDKVTESSQYVLIRKTLEFEHFDLKYREVLTATLSRFNETIAATWPPSASTPTSSSGPRYSIKVLYDAFEARRPRRPGEPSLNGSKDAYWLAIDLLENLREEPVLPNIAEVCAFISAHAIVKSQNFPISANDLSTLATYTSALRNSLDPRKLAPLPASIVQIMAQQRRLGQLSWNRYFNESMDALDGQLQQNAHLSIAPGAFRNDQGRDKFWEQICKSLCLLMLSSEVSIYRLKISDENRPLVLIGSYCTGESGREKSKYKSQFMFAAATNLTARTESASYRAADRNIAQDVPDTKAGGALIPEERAWRWGRSLLAVPLVVEGAVWGVIEFVSHGERHYGSLLRPQCEAVATYLSNTLLMGNVFEALAKADAYWSDDFTADHGRRTSLCKTLATVFNAGSLAIFTATRSDDGEYFNTARFGAWPDKGRSRRIEPTRIRQFLESEQRVLQLTSLVTPEPADEEIELLVRLDPPQMRHWAGALLIRRREPRWPEPNWADNAFALAQVVCGVVSNVTSNASWNREARLDLRHETSRITESLEGVESRLSKRLTMMSVEADRTVVEDAIYDIANAIGGFRVMSETLLADVYDRVLQGGGRVIAMKKMMEEYQAGPRQGVSPTGLFLGAFRNAVRAMPQRGLRVTLPSSTPYRVRMDRITLAQILGTLADNVAKYATSNSDISVLYQLTDVNLTMTISNLGPPLSPEEEDQIFTNGFRGTAARLSHPQRGQGLGLSFAKETAELWNVFLSHRQDKTTNSTIPEVGGDAVWHRLTLIFPRSIVATQGAN